MKPHKDGSKRDDKERRRRKESGSENVGDKTERREKEDREAKRRARRTSPKRSTDKSRQRSRNDDDKDAKRRARRHDHMNRAGTPGVTYERSEGHSDEMNAPATAPPRGGGDRNFKLRCGPRATTPGTASVGSTSTSAEGRIRRKIAREDAGKSPTVGHQSRKEMSSDGNKVSSDETQRTSSAFEVNASLVTEDVDDKKIKKMEEMESRIQQQMEQMNRAVTKQNEEDAEEQNRSPSSSSNKKWMVLVVLIVLVGGGVGAYFGTRPSSNDTPADVESPGKVVATTSPIVGTGVPTYAPVSVLSSMPSASPAVELAYQQPSSEDCEAIANKQNISGQEEMEVLTYLAILDMDPVPTFNAGLPFIEDLVQSKIVPELVGCTTLERQLIRTPRLSHGNRKLDDKKFRYVIRNVAVEALDLEDESCKHNPTASCKVISVRLDVAVKGTVNMLFLRKRVNNSFSDDNLEKHFGSSFTSVKLNEMSLETATKNPPEEPSVAPSTLSPSANPMTQSTLSPSANPMTQSTLSPSAKPMTQSTLSPSAKPITQSTLSPSAKPMTQSPSLAPKPMSTPNQNPDLSPTGLSNGIPCEVDSECESLFCEYSADLVGVGNNTICRDEFEENGVSCLLGEDCKSGRCISSVCG